MNFSVYKKKKSFYSDSELLMGKIISISVMALSAFLIPIVIIQRKDFFVVLNIIQISMYLFSYILIAKKRNMIPFFVCSYIIIFGLELMYLKNGGTEGFGIFWFVLVPVFTLFLLDIRNFALLNYSILFIIVIAFVTPLNKFCYEFGTTVKSRYPVLFFLEITFSLYVKYQFEKTESAKEELFNKLVDLKDNLRVQVEDRTKEVQEQHDKTETLMIELTTAMVNSIDAKDKYTSGHSKRVAEYSKMIAAKLGKNEKEQEEIYLIGLMHDIGKIGIPDWIINKTERLTDEEFDIIKRHPVIGFEIVEKISSMPTMKEGVRWHHERIDGNGYPDGLKDDEIPEYARIISVADSYDAMTSNRSYRDALPQSKVRSEIEKGKGSQFDSAIADIMLQLIDEDKDYTLKEHPKYIEM